MSLPSVDIHYGDNLDVMVGMSDSSFDLIYVDPPFNTGKAQQRQSIRVVQDTEGDRVGFQDKKYRTLKLGSMSYADVFDDYLSFLEPRFLEAYRMLKPEGSFFVHIDYREVHYVKVLLDLIFGRQCFMNEIIWAYDYGARSKSKWSTKHDTILWYAKTPDRYTFNYEEVDRIPYMAPGLVGREKASRGKAPTDVWWHTIVPTNSKERTGYPTQKPFGVLKRLVLAHSKPEDRALDFFAGSGTLGDVCAYCGRHSVLIDNSKAAVSVMWKRLRKYNPSLKGIAEDDLHPVHLDTDPGEVDGDSPERHAGDQGRLF